MIDDGKVDDKKVVDGKVDEVELNFTSQHPIANVPTHGPSTLRPLRLKSHPSTFPLIPNNDSPQIPAPKLPHPPHPRTWLITAATSPIGLSVACAALAHGDSVIAGVEKGGTNADDERGEDFREFYTQKCVREGWRERIRGGTGGGVRVPGNTEAMGDNQLI